MNELPQLLNVIQNLQQTELEQIIAVAQKRLHDLQRQKGVLKLILVQGEYVLRLEGTGKGIKLGPPLSSAAALRQATTPAPSPADFEIPKPQAQQLMNQKPEAVGWWDVDNSNGLSHRRYYLVEPYHQARAAWHEQHQLTSDPLALAFHLSAASVRRVRELEKEGYTIQLPD